jgi:hypothetical protein
MAEKLDRWRSLPLVSLKEERKVPISGGSYRLAGSFGKRRREREERQKERKL